MSLPLKVRKSIKDSEGTQNAALDSLNKSELGGEWSFECDYGNAYQLALKGRVPSDAENLGGLIIGNLENIARGIIRFIKSSPLKLEIIKEAVTARKIVYHIIDKPSLPATTDERPSRKIFQARVENGTLVFQVAKGEFPAYIDDVDKELDTAFDDPEGLSLLSRVDIAKSQEKLEELKEKLKTVTGQEFEVDIDYAQITKDWKKANKDVTKKKLDGVGDLMISSYLEALVRNVERICQDDMSKEAFVEAVNKKTIKFQLYTITRAEKDSFYTRSKIVDGTLVIQIDSSSCAMNADNTGDDLEKLL